MKTTTRTAVAAVAAATLLGTTPALAANYAYPNAGQSDAQVRQDRFECHEWSVGQTGFDPINDVEQSRDKPLFGAKAKGAGVGAGLGALIGSNSGNAGEGAAIGAAIGAIGGAVAENQRDNNAPTRENYERAFDSCMAARNYTVR